MVAVVGHIRLEVQCVCSCDEPSCFAQIAFRLCGQDSSYSKGNTPKKRFLYALGLDLWLTEPVNV